MSSHVRRFLIAIAALTVCDLPSRGYAIDAETALAAQKAARELIASAHAKIHVRSHVAHQSHSFEWWHAGSSFRVIESHSDTSSGRQSLMYTEERGILNGDMRTLVRSKDDKPSQATINDERELSSTGGLWSAGLCWLNNECNRYYEDEFPRKGRFSDLTSSRDGNLIRLSARMIGGNWYDIWLDPEKNYIITKKALRGVKDPAVVAACEEATQVSEIKPGIFYPTKVVVKSKGDLTHERTISFLSVNEPIQEEKLRVRFPNNTHVFDAARQTAYIVNAAEERISHEVFIRPPVQHRALAVETSLTGPPGISGWTIAGISAGVVALLLVALKVARRRWAELEA